MAEIQLSHVDKVYEGTEAPAVHDLNLRIADGEFMVLVGPSGCGKTTALRIVAGLEDITEGELSIGGRVVNDVPTSARCARRFVLCTPNSCATTWSPGPQATCRPGCAFGYTIVVPGNIPTVTIHLAH